MHVHVHVHMHVHVIIAKHQVRGSRNEPLHHPLHPLFYFPLHQAWLRDYLLHRTKEVVLKDVLQVGAPTPLTTLTPLTPP